MKRCEDCKFWDVGHFDNNWSGRCEVHTRNVPVGNVETMHDDSCDDFEKKTEATK